MCLLCAYVCTSKHRKMVTTTKCFASQQHLLVIPEYAACLQDEQTWQSLSALSSLRSLQLYDFQLADLPAEVVLLTKLTSLCIDNGLRSMSRDLSPLENLVQLRLSCECLSSLPPMLSTCRSLEELVLTECRMEISSEPVKALKDLPRLQQIILDMYSLGADKGERERAFMRLARELPSVKLSFQSE